MAKSSLANHTTYTTQSFNALLIKLIKQSQTTMILPTNFPLVMFILTILEMELPITVPTSGLLVCQAFTSNSD